jgi:hypothetical protein
MGNVLYLTSDLLFSSRVAGVARQIGIDLVVAGSRDKLRDLLEANHTSAIIVDLEHRDADPVQVIAMLETASRRPTTIGYGPHVKEPLLSAARDAGFDIVLSRGQFDQQIGHLLKSLAPTP